ncbi:MAG: DUF4331 family protein [Myxococcota bacterium]
MNVHIKTAVAVLALGVMASMSGPDAQAADHIDAPLAMADNAADITDFYAWRQGDDRIVAAVGFAGLDMPGGEGIYDRAALYGIHIDTDLDNVADQTIWARFGQAPDESWGVLIEGLPGADDEVIGPVNTVLDAGGDLQAFAGVRDDPFFFDFDGFQATLATGDLSFDSTNDSFAGTNVTMLIVEMDLDAAAGGAEDIQIWATSARLEEER